MKMPGTSQIGWCGLLASATALLMGCATPSMEAARHQFYGGQFEKAEETLEKTGPSSNERVLYLMERGTIRQMAGDYKNSSHDYIEAFNLLENMAPISATKSPGSLVINDTVQDFRGAPFERTMLHDFTAINHFAQTNWENAAVEARRIIRSLDPDVKKDYPDDAFSRYMAGFALEMIGDYSNAKLQYRKAGELLSDVAIDLDSGRFAHKISATTNGTPVDPVFDKSKWNNELVCFVMIGQAPPGDITWDAYRIESRPVYAEIYHDGKYLGRSFNLADTEDLAFTTEQKEAAKKLIKTVARLAVKEAITYQVRRENELIGALVGFVLLQLLEQPDVRRWETLPRWLQVARVPCPEGLDEFDVIFRNSSGVETGKVHVKKPITQNHHTYVSFCRDIKP